MIDESERESLSIGRRVLSKWSLPCLPTYYKNEAPETQRVRLGSFKVFFFSLHHTSKLELPSRIWRAADEFGVLTC